MHLSLHWFLFFFQEANIKFEPVWAFASELALVFCWWQLVIILKVIGSRGIQSKLQNNLLISMKNNYHTILNEYLVWAGKNLGINHLFHMSFRIQDINSW